MSAKYNRLYHDLAEYWPVISPITDYAAEAELIYDLLNWAFQESPLSEGPWTVLELGCGSGHMLHHLSQYCHAHGLDKEASMLAMCRENNPEMPVHQACMTDFNLVDEDGRPIQFDAIIAYDAIDYLLTLIDAGKACEHAVKHLKKGGLILFAPTYTKETFQPASTEPFEVTMLKEQGEISLQVTTDVKQTLSHQDQISLTITITPPDNDEEKTIIDLHPCGLFHLREWQDVMTGCDLELLNLNDFLDSAGMAMSDLPFQVLIGQK